jgi:hypothetical protein
MNEYMKKGFLFLWMRSGAFGNPILNRAGRIPDGNSGDNRVRYQNYRIIC